MSADTTKFSRLCSLRHSLLLSRQTGNDPALTGLLRVYKDYYPEIIVGDATRGKASAFNVRVRRLASIMHVR